MARPLNAASPTMIAGSSRKPRIAATTRTPNRWSSRCEERRGMSMRPDFFQRPGRGAQERQHREGERKTGDREACGERKIEARESELIDEVRHHIDLAAADQLRRRERAEGPGKGRRYAGNDAG